MIRVQTPYLNAHCRGCRSVPELTRILLLCNNSLLGFGESIRCGNFLLYFIAII